MADFKITIDTSELGPGLEAWTERTIAALKLGINYSTQAVAERVVSTKLSGQVLQRRTGALAGSVRQELAQQIGRTIQGAVTAGGADIGVPYARIHEYGGVITAKRSPYLIWYSDEYGWVKKKSVTMPARPYMIPTLQEMREEIVGILSRALADASTK